MNSEIELLSLRTDIARLIEYAQSNSLECACVDPQAVRLAKEIQRLKAIIEVQRRELNKLD